MEMIDNGLLLSVIVFLPVLGALVALAFPKEQGVRSWGLWIGWLNLALAVGLWAQFDTHHPGMQFETLAPWLPELGISYHLGVDGLSMLLIVLTNLLFPLVLLASKTNVTQHAREYVLCLLLLQTGVLGAFTALDLILFYVFWELMLIPMYFLIGIWGGADRIYAALKFFLYTMAGSLLMLVAILVVAIQMQPYGGLSFDWAVLSERLMAHPPSADALWPTLCFWAFTLAFLIKVPVFPLHTWLPDAHVQAPTGGSVILAGVLLKLGTYGLLRFAFWFFPEVSLVYIPLLGTIAVIGILYGAFLAMVQRDVKRLVAYSSISHLGFVLLGCVAFTVAGLTGGVVQMVNHGISTAGLFFLVGVIYERRHTRELSDFGGLAKVMPWYATFWVIITMSSIAVPGLNGFVGEFLILAGTFKSTGLAVANAQIGDYASIALWSAHLLGLCALLGVLLRVWGTHSTLRSVDRWLGSGVALALWLVLIAPRVGAYEGGLLVRPLYAALKSTEIFSYVYQSLAIIAATGVIFAAVYLLVATQKMFFGPIKHRQNQKLSDLSLREVGYTLPLVLIAMVTGVYPAPLLRTIEPTVQHYTQVMRARTHMGPESMVVLTHRPESHDASTGHGHEAGGDGH